MATTTFSNITNNAKTTLNGAINAVVTACTVASGSSLPSVPFYATIFENDPDVNEIVKVTAKSGTSITTMVRAQQGTAANSWANAANFQVLWTKTNVTELQSAINDIETRLGSGTTDVTIATGDLDQERDGAVLNNTFTSYNAGATNLPWDFKISRGSKATPVIVNDLDEVALKFWGHDGSAFRQFAAIKAYINGTPGASDMPGALAFYVSPDGGVTPAVALTLAQDKSAAFAGAVTMASTLNVTGAFTCQSTANIYSTLFLGSTGASNRACVIRANSGYRADFYFGGDGTALRWQWSKASTSEVGANAGSEMNLSAFTDLGAFIDTPISVLRASGGAITFARPLTLSGTNALTVGGNFSFNGAGAFGDASTDLITCTGRLLVRSVTDAGPMTATPGTQREIVYNTSNSKVYVCTVTHATAATWSALN